MSETSDGDLIPCRIRNSASMVSRLRIRSIVLPYQRASLAVEFAAMHFADPKQNRYAYQLVGFDSDWLYTDSSRRVASYTNLPFGE